MSIVTWYIKPRIRRSKDGRFECVGFKESGFGASPIEAYKQMIEAEAKRWLAENAPIFLF